MGNIRLEYDNQFIIISKHNDFYQINDIKQWIFLTQFSHAFLII